MKVLLIAILACFGVNALADDHMGSDSPTVTPTETMSIYMDHFNNADMDALNEMLEPPFFFLRDLGFLVEDFSRWVTLFERLRFFFLNAIVVYIKEEILFKRLKK